MNRTIGIIVTLLWVGAMAALIERDLVPFWTAQEPPSRNAPESRLQVGLFDDGGRRVGTTWITTHRAPDETTVQSTTSFELGRLTALLPGLKKLVLDSSLVYDADGGVEQFTFALHGAGLPIQVTGERYGRDIACSARFGGMTRTMMLDAGLSRQLGESLRPFTHLEGLHVGQSWRVRLLDPFALVKDQTIAFDLQLARVTRRETIDHGGRPVVCFRVETEGSVAWADDTGRILRQEVEAPLLGRWVLKDEPFDEPARSAVRAAIHRSIPNG